MLKKLSKSGEYTHMLIILALLAIYFFTPAVDFTMLVSTNDIAPAGMWIQEYVVLVPLLGKLVNILLIVLIISQLNSIGIRTEIIPRRSFITSSLLVALLLFSPVEAYFTKALFIMLLLVYGYANTMSMFGKQYPYTQVLNASIAISLSSMILPHTILFIFFIWLAFFTYSVNSWREWFISIIGLVIPYIYLAFAYFWNDNLIYFIDIYKTFFSNPDFTIAMPSMYLMITFCLIIIVYFAVMLPFINNASDKVISVRKGMWLTFQFSFIAIIVIATSGSSFFIILPVLFAPMALMLSYNIHDQKRSRVYDVLFSLLLISILINRIIV